jgi:hypothetical protein
LRPRIVGDKYFIPYLLALQQRLVLNRAIDDAARIVSMPRRARAGQLARLREDLLDFGVGGHFMQVSSRHALHRYYRLARRGLERFCRGEALYRRILAVIVWRMLSSNGHFPVALLMAAD